MSNLWGGRFEKEMDDMVERLNASIEVDKRMYDCDIEGSIAHVTMLSEIGVVTTEEKERIVESLKKIRERIQIGELNFTYKDEDIHMAIEGLLITELGDIGKKLHTARSRNDQAALDTKLYLKKEINEIINNLITLEKTFLKKAKVNINKPIAGFTHMQHAQPVTIGFYFMAYFQMFKRDIQRLYDTYSRLDYCPLGACALAGTTIPINRKRTSDLLGFKMPTQNAMDSVSDRDYIIEFLSDASISMMHISRLAEELILWNSHEFSYIIIDDSFCTGSSIMPQKKNPDVAELLRGKVGRVYGNLVQMLTLLKGTPLAYNKDFQEDKEGLFDTIDTWKTSIQILEKMIEKIEFRADKIENQLNEGFLNATDLAEHFVKLGIPFRKAHEIVGEMVKYCEKTEKSFVDLTDSEIKEIDKRLTVKDIPDLSVETCIGRRKSYGGTAPIEVERQILEEETWLSSLNL